MDGKADLIGEIQRRRLEEGLGLMESWAQIANKHNLSNEEGAELYIDSLASQQGQKTEGDGVEKQST